MVVIKKIGDNYYLCKKKRGLYRGSHNIQEKFTNKFRISANWHKKGGKLNLHHSVTIVTPEELVGKKIMLKVITIEDKKEFKLEELEGIYG